MANITQIDLGAITPIPKGDYSLTTSYERLNLVVYNGSSWIRTEKEPYVVGSIPQTGSLYWQLNASGVSEIPDASLTVKGITKLSNATNSVDETVAATSRAVKSAYDIGSTAVSNATTANNTANSALSTANTAKAVTDKVSTTPAAGKIPLADSDGKIDKNWIEIPSGMPIGSIFSHLCSSTFTPDGCLPVDGAEYTKAQFSDFYTNYLASGKLLTCTYAEFAAQVASTDNCGKFALDTVNQKFKVPLLKDGDSLTHAASVGEIGKSVEAGLPNITGQLGHGWSDGATTEGGAFRRHSTGGGSSAASAGNGITTYWTYNASLSNSIYGNSNTVTDEQVRLRHFIVVANGTINQSMMDWSAWATGLAGKANMDLSNCTKPYITETWKSSDGSSWYRKYNDGWVEQGGRTSKLVTDESKIINFNHAFSNTNYTFITSSQAMDSETTLGRIGTINKTLNKTYAKVTSNGWATSYTGFVVLWYACGY